MSAYEICTTVIAALAIVVSPLITVLVFNKKKEVYLVKKEAIFESLKFLDDFLSTKSYDDYCGDIVKNKITTNEENLTIKARECFNKLIITCKNAEIIDCFCKLILPENYYEDGKIKMADYHKFRMLCRKELGLSGEPKYNSDKITFLAKIK